MVEISEDLNFARSLASKFQRLAVAAGSDRAKTPNNKPDATAILILLYMSGNPITVRGTDTRINTMSANLTIAIR